METWHIAICPAYPLKSLLLNILSCCLYKPQPCPSKILGSESLHKIALELAQTLLNSDFASKFITVHPHSLFLSKSLPVSIDG